MLALTGMICVVGIEIGGKPLGIILGVLAAIIYSIYIITGSRIMSNTNIIASATVIMMSAGAVYTVAILIRGAQFPTQTAGWGAIGGIVVISTIVAFFEGLKRIGPVHSSMFSNLEPVVTIVLAWSIFSEEITLIKFIGGLMILAAGIILAKKPSKFPPGK